MERLAARSKAVHSYAEETKAFLQSQTLHVSHQHKQVLQKVRQDVEICRRNRVTKVVSGQKQQRVDI